MSLKYVSNAARVQMFNMRAAVLNTAHEAFHDMKLGGPGKSR